MKNLSEYIEDIYEEAVEGETYVLYQVGGSIGEKANCRVGSKAAIVIYDNLTKEDAEAKKKVLNSTLSPGDKKYYGIKYLIAPASKIKYLNNEK